VLLYEEQRSNGITTQRRILSETFGKEWYNVSSQEALNLLNEKVGEGIDHIFSRTGNKTLGELVSEPSTPYFRMDSLMPEKLLETVKLRINVSGGGLIGKTQRALESLGLGAYYEDVFDLPDLIRIIQMSSRIKGSKGIVTDEVAYSTWGCGNGAVIGTGNPDEVIRYYTSNGIPAKHGGWVNSFHEVSIESRGYDSQINPEGLTIVHGYKDKPLG